MTTVHEFFAKRGILALIFPVLSRWQRSSSAASCRRWGSSAPGLRRTSGFSSSVVLFVLVARCSCAIPARATDTDASLDRTVHGGGQSKVIFALTIRPFPNWGWVLLSGIVGIMLALVLWASMPVAAAWLLGALLAIGLVSEGFALAWLAWRVRQA